MDWEQIESVFAQGSALSPAEREALLAAVSDDTAARVRQLWKDADRAGSFLSVSLIQLGDAPARRPGDLVAGRFTLLEFLGSGGMGEVFKARDELLGRTVALKFVRQDIAAPEQVRTRVEREARALCALAHPNVCTFHDIVWDGSEQVLVMECLEGETLAERLRRGALPLPELLRIALEVLGGLRYAHDVRIVHRDLKPANIMLTRTGAKLFDFGIATQRQPEGAPSTTTVTRRGGLLGSLSYMSPEQITGQPVDSRSDIFAFGSLLYEMATGRRAFARDTELATIAAILEAEPEPLPRLAADAPRALAEVVDQCLQKDPDRRFQRVAELEQALWAITTPVERGSEVPPPRRLTFASLRPHVIASTLAGAALLAAVGGVGWFGYEGLTNAPSASRPDAIAVLPFEVQTGAEDVEYIADGLAESVTNSLSRLSGVRVAARSRAFAFKGRPATVEEVGRRLNVKAIVTGKVARAGNRLRVQAELTDVAAGTQLWGKQYEGGEDDLLTIQSELTRELSQRLSAGRDAAASARVRTASTTDPRAYQLYLRGRHAQFSMRDSAKAIPYFRDALDIDPTYARAYAGLAVGYINQGSDDDLMKGRAAAMRALELEPELAEAHFALGFMHGWWEFDWEESEKALQRAVELEPEDALTRIHYGWLLIHTGRGDAGFAHGRAAFELDPLDPFIEMAFAQMHYACGHTLMAIDRLRHLRASLPDFYNAHWALGYAYLVAERWNEAIKELSDLRGLGWFVTDTYAYQAYAYSKLGDRARAHEMALAAERRLDQTGPMSAYTRAVTSAARGRYQDVADLLEQARRQRDARLIIFLSSIDPAFEEARQDPRVPAVTVPITRAGLTPCRLPS